jgi:hypothetical protein
LKQTKNLHTQEDFLFRFFVSSSSSDFVLKSKYNAYSQLRRPSIVIFLCGVGGAALASLHNGCVRSANLKDTTEEGGFHGLINYIDTKANCHHLEKLTCKWVFAAGVYQSL